MPIRRTTPFTPYYDVSATTQTTATTNGLANASLMAGMTISPEPGVYQFAFSGSLGYATANVNVYCTIFVGGTQYGGGEYSRSTVPYGKNGSAADRSVMSIAGIITVTSGQAVEVRWYASGGQMSCDQRCLSLAQVG